MLKQLSIFNHFSIYHWYEGLTKLAFVTEVACAVADAIGGPMKRSLYEELN